MPASRSAIRRSSSIGLHHTRPPGTPQRHLPEAVHSGVVVARAVILFTLYGWLAGCGQDDRGRRERTDALVVCADALERSVGGPAGDQVEGVARGCPAACPGLAGWVTARAPGRIRVRGDGAASVPDERS